MSVSRANLVTGAAAANWNGAWFFTKDDIMVDLEPTLKDVETSIYGRVDKTPVDRVIKIPLWLYGAWEQLPKIFPAAIMNPVLGTRLFGTTDLPLVIHSKNGDRITFANAQITKLANLFLGAQAQMFAAALEMTCLIKNSTQPEAAGAYYVVDSAAYVEATTAFSKANYKQNRFTAAWGAVAGFTSFQAQKGWEISWSLELGSEPIDGSGTVDMYIKNFLAQAKCKPLEPTMAQIEAASFMQLSALGSLISANAFDLTLTGAGGGQVIVLKNAAITKSGYAFGVEPLRNGEIVWETTRGFTAGAPAAVASVA